MSYASEHDKMKPVLKAAQSMSIADNPYQDAIFDPLSAGFNIWCTPENNPGGKWNEVLMIAGAFSKPCEFVGTATWEWLESSEPKIVGLELVTNAYSLADTYPHEFTNKIRYDFGNLISTTNRKEDIDWCKRKISDLFESAGLPIPAISVRY